MRKTIDIFKAAAASTSDQINSMANSIDIPVKTKAPIRGLYTKTEMGKDQTRFPADMNKVAAISPRAGISMLSKGSRTSSGKSGLSSLSNTKAPQTKVNDGVMQDQLDASQYRHSLDRKDFAGQGFSSTVDSKRAPGLGDMLKR